MTQRKKDHNDPISYPSYFVRENSKASSVKLNKYLEKVNLKKRRVEFEAGVVVFDLLFTQQQMVRRNFAGHPRTRFLRAGHCLNCIGGRYLLDFVKRRQNDQSLVSPEAAKRIMRAYNYLNPR